VDNFYPWWFLIMLFWLLWSALRSGEKTTHRDEEIDDYWSDG